MSTKHIIDGQAVARPEFARTTGGANSGNTKGARKSNREGSNTHVKHGKKIFVGGLSHQTNEAALRAHFEQFGRLTDAVVMHEAGSRKPRGFGFVTFADAASVTKVLQSRYHPIDGRGVEVKPAVPRDLMPSEQVRWSVRRLCGGRVERVGESVGWRLRRVAPQTRAYSPSPTQPLRPHLSFDLA